MNHFIELAEDSQGNKYLLIHTGSRHFGHQIATHYQKLAEENLRENKSGLKRKKEEIIRTYKEQGRHREIQKALQELDSTKVSIVQHELDLAYVENEELDNYLNDMAKAQLYAKYNRTTIAQVILSNMGWLALDTFDTVHNYIDVYHMILRKGAVSAQRGEHLVIPINMRDGTILAIGKGNSDWNFTAPHGAGRILSRKQAKEVLSIDDFKETMKGIYTTSVNESTIDEAPMVYKSFDEIMEKVKETVEIIDVLKPIYNFKAN